LITSYSDIFIYRYVFSGLLLPLFILVGKYLQVLCYHRLNREQKEKQKAGSDTDASRANVYRFIFQLVSQILPVIIRLIDDQHNDQSLVTNKKGMTTKTISNKTTMNPLVEPILRNDGADDSVNEDPNATTVATINNSTLIRVDHLLAYRRSRKTLFDKEIFTIDFIVDMAVLMTFGTIFPPLGFVIFMNMLVNTFLTQMWIGRFVYLAKQISTDLIAKSLLPLVDFLNEECKDVGQLIFNSIPTIAFLATVFWAFALFDTLGDSVGTLQALWILLLMGLMPVWVSIIEYICGLIKQWYRQTHEVRSVSIANKHSDDTPHFNQRLESTAAGIGMFRISEHYDDELSAADEMENRMSSRSFVVSSSNGHSLRSVATRTEVSETARVVGSRQDSNNGIELRPSIQSLRNQENM
jgi:hypothetical protein